jgi:hypothetical protein
VFTARYARSPYITQITFVFKRLITYHPDSLDNVISIVTRLWVGGSRFRIPAGTRAFSFLENDHTDPGSHPGCQGSSDRSLSLNTHILLVSGLRMSGVENDLRWVKMCSLKFCKSVRHRTFQINQATRCNNFSSLLLDVYVQLNMFRTSSSPSSGAQQLQ